MKELNKIRVFLLVSSLLLLAMTPGDGVSYDIGFGGYGVLLDSFLLDDDSVAVVAVDDTRIALTVTGDPLKIYWFPHNNSALSGLPDRAVVQGHDDTIVVTLNWLDEPVALSPTWVHVFTLPGGRRIVECHEKTLYLPLVVAN